MVLTAARAFTLHRAAGSVEAARVALVARWVAFVCDLPLRGEEAGAGPFLRLMVICATFTDRQANQAATPTADRLLTGEQRLKFRNGAFFENTQLNVTAEVFDVCHDPVSLYPPAPVASGKQLVNRSFKDVNSFLMFLSIIFRNFLAYALTRA